MQLLPQLQRLFAIDLLENESDAVGKGPKSKVFLIFDRYRIQNLFLDYGERLFDIIHGVAYDLSELWHELPFGALAVLRCGVGILNASSWPMLAQRVHLLWFIDDIRKFLVFLRRFKPGSLELVCEYVAEAGNHVVQGLVCDHFWSHWHSQIWYGCVKSTS